LVKGNLSKKKDGFPVVSRRQTFKEVLKMADYYVNIFLDDEKMKKLEAVGLVDQVKELDGKKAVQVGMGKMDQKKLVKGFPGLTFDSSNACVLPEDAENVLFKMIVDLKTVDVMKAAIMKLYNPLAGKSLRSATSA
jgi:hypothetical protein